MKNWLIFGICCVILAACGGVESDPEAAVRAWVTDAEAAAEEKDRRGLLAMISERYADSRGNNHDSIGDMLRRYFFTQQSVALISGIDEISLMGDSAALVQLTVGMAGTNNSAFGVSADAYQFEFELEVIDDDWMLIGARWGELGENMR
jgi:hypothetical protein